MTDLNAITDLEELRGIARLLLSENAHLHKNLQHLSNKVDKLTGNDAATLQQEILSLKRELERERSKVSKPKSERRRPHRRAPSPTPQPQSGGKRTEQPQLPIVEEVHELPENERLCPICHGVARLFKGQFEESELVTVVEREFKIRKILRQKYVHTCECDTPKVVTAPGALKVVAKGRYDLPFAVAVAVAKYVDHIPLERQATQMRRDGLKVMPNVLWDQLYHLHRYLQPTYDAIWASAFDELALGADETSWPMLEKGRKLWQVRCLTSAHLSYFRIVTQKDTASALDLLTHPHKGVFTGVLVTDGASAYDAARRESNNAFDLQNCWSHARRKFLDAEPNYPQAAGALDIIDKLFAVEREAQANLDVPLEVARAHLRSEKSAGIVAELREWMKSNATAWDGSDLNKAIRYLSNRWDKLTFFLTRPEAPIHNNASEFALRKPVQGRKNFYGAKSLAGTQVAAVFYTTFETARKHDLNPTTYLLAAADRAIRSPGAALLPWELS